MVKTPRRDVWSNETWLGEIRKTWITSQQQGRSYESGPTVLGDRVNYILDGRLKAT